MGYAERIGMESRRRSVLSGPGSSLDIRGQTSKSSPFCPHTSTKVAQYLIQAHMMSHYKRIYSAKAVIDTTAPKSLTLNVKYRDRMRQERLKKGGRPQSAQSLSHRNSRASCSSAQSRCSVQSEGRPYVCSRSSMVSSPRFSHSLYAKELPSPPYEGAPQNHPCRPYSAAEPKRRSRDLTTQLHPSACSLYTPGDQSFYKSFQDPAKKTYSGDLLQKHSQRFTQDKPFTPKTLKSEKSSYLSSYRYYRAPCNNAAALECEDSTRPQHHNHIKTSEHTLDLCEPPQSKEHQRSEDEYNGALPVASRQQANRNREYDSFDYSSRVPLEEERKESPVMKNISAEDEELMYLEFISDVTEDILSRGFISNRVLDRLIQRHIDTNLHRLDEAKMRHLLDILRNNLDEPSTLSSNSEELVRKDASSLLDSLLASDQVKTEDDLFSCGPLRKYGNCPGSPEAILSSTPPLSPKRSSPFEKERTREDENSSGDFCNNGDKKDDEDQHDKKDDGSSEPDADGQTKELEDLARQFSESLQVDQNNVDTNANASVSAEDL